ELRRAEARRKKDWPIASPGMVAGGSVLTAAGGAGYFSLVGVLLVGLHAFGKSFPNCPSGGALGLTFVFRSLAIGAGIPLIVAGKTKVPPAQKPVARVHVGPQGGAFTLQF